MSRVLVTLEWVLRLDIGFIDHLYTQIVSKNNYSTNADFHTLQITTAAA
jgi:hypothetical protein